MPTPPVRIKGLRELDRALGRADKNLRKNLRDELRDVADNVASHARTVANRKGLRRSGDLISGIRPFVRSGGAGVRSNAAHGGYPYPSRLEYEDRGGRPYGPRASLNPAVEELTPEIHKDMESVLDRVADDFNEGG